MFIALLIISILVCASVCIYLLNKHYKAKLTNFINQNNHLSQENIRLGEIHKHLVKYEAEKKTLDEKNKKVWLMNEEVYKQKKLVDEENEKLISEKTKLEDAKKKVDERVKKLWQQSTAIHEEKEKINLLKLEIEEKHQSIKDSIEYARVIQRAILPPQAEIKKHLPNSYVLFKPRDIVSGDFYWFHVISEKRLILAAADCTGHGVPGAFMSMIGNTLLNEIVNEKKNYEPSEVLNLLNRYIRFTLKQDDVASETRDGMDIAICEINLETNVVTYAGANRPFWLLRKNEENKFELIETKANKFPIGGIKFDFEKVFTSHTFQLKKDDVFYIFSDGYADQFGGAKGKKFMTPNFQKLLLDIANEPMLVQQLKVNTAFENWRGMQEQVDDVLVIGVKM